MKVLVACEESQEVTKAFRKRGHEAYSNDLQPCSGGHSEWHLQMDCREARELKKWDLIILFYTCTYLTISANKWYKDQPPRKSGTLVGEARRQARKEAIEFIKEFVQWCEDNGIPLGLENPVGVLSTELRKPDQVIQPWMFGHGETKATCLWLWKLPKLKPTNIVEGREQRLHRLPKTEDRAKIRSKTFPGIADAMAEQWGGKRKRGQPEKPPTKVIRVPLSKLPEIEKILKRVD